MTMPVPRRRPVERWRRGAPRDFWDPLGEFAVLWDRMGQLFETAGDGSSDSWVPTVETDESDDAYLVRAELPGMKKDDVDVELRGNELRITGEVKADGNGDGKTLRQRRGKFAYRASLPADAEPQKVNAELSDGVLTVRVPKAAQAQARKIRVKA
jgi:HSP20 family protein